MAQTFELIVKPSLFSSERKLSIQPAFIEFDTINFSKLEIAELRYGVKAIKGYRFIIGRIYCIDIKNVDDKIIKLRLLSLYRVKRMLLGEKYKKILTAIFENYVEDIVDDFIKSFNSKIDFTLLGNTFTQDGILLHKTNEIISWLDLGTKDFWRYFLLFSVLQPDKYKTFYYLTDWNTIVLKSVTGIF